jgi:hypothetical protein
MRNIPQVIRDIVSKMSDSELIDKVNMLRDSRLNIWDNFDAKQIDDTFFRYVVEDMDATLDVYEALARERGLDV